MPLPVVIEAIARFFEKNETSGRRKVNPASAIAACGEGALEERKGLFVGAGEETAGDVTRSAARCLASRLRARRGAVADRVRALASLRSVPAIEEQLIELEREMFDSLDAADLQKEVESMLDTSKLDEKTRARTLEANLRRLIRERFGLPRLTLFG